MSSHQCKTCEKLKNPDFNCDSNEGSLYLNLNSSSESQISSKSVISLPNKSFPAQKVWEIERDNALLAERISYHHGRPRQYKTTIDTFRKVSSSEINRKKHQEKISRENQILLKKIQSVKPAVRYG